MPATAPAQTVSAYGKRELLFNLTNFRGVKIPYVALPQAFTP